MKSWDRGGNISDEVAFEAEIKRELFAGEKPTLLAEKWKTPVNAIYNIKNGRRAFYVPWPDGNIGAMPSYIKAQIAKMRKFRGVSKEQQDTYQMYEDLQEKKLNEKPNGEFEKAQEKVCDFIAANLKDEDKREQIKELNDLRCRALLEEDDNKKRELQEEFVKEYENYKGIIESE